MQRSRYNEWEDNNPLYTENQVDSLLRECGVEVITDTETHFLCLCPFHGNSDTPALEVSKELGLWLCFNPSCEESGTLADLIRRLKKINPFQVERLILKHKDATARPIDEEVEKMLARPVEFPLFPQDVIDSMKANFPGSIGQDYMVGRGFDKETLDYFDVGYSERNNMVVVPMHDPGGSPVGLIGRTPSTTDKRFKNSVGLPKAKTAWNFHRAKRYGGAVIVCEASYDAMRIHQAGFPNVIALLGGSATRYHLDQINKHFSTVIIMTDFDNKQFKPNCRKCKGIQFKRNETHCVGHRPGRELGRQIVNGIDNKKMMWAAYSDQEVFPHGAKDACDMTDEEIRQCLNNAVSNLQYILWEIES